jgi:GT2 family glycosyltransferase
MSEAGTDPRVNLTAGPPAPSAYDPRLTREDDTSANVTVAYIHGNEIKYNWHRSMIELIGWDLANQSRIIGGGYIAIRAGTDGMTQARNKAIVDFLAERNADWLFWIDTDMGFSPDIIDRLMEAADPVERPIVGALAFSQREEVDDGMGGFRCRATPTVFDWRHGEGDQLGFAIRFDYPKNALTQCAGTGSACVLIHRSVFEKIEVKYGRAWYDRVPNTTTGQVLSEDLAFCLRAGTLGIPVYVHTGVKTTHLKPIWLAEDDYFAQIKLAQVQSEEAEEPVPPATQATAVIVPVMRRPQNAEPFMASLRSSGAPLAEVYAVVDDGDYDTEEAWKAAGAQVIHAGFEEPGTFAQKVNLGCAVTAEPWLFIVGDDVAFKPGWLDHAQHASRDGAHVIGTNDLHNPRVKSGEHGTHLLIRREYVSERGASWDGPSVVAHEGYRHWYVDDEIVTAAKQRGVWAFAAGAKVEHMHPLWGLAPDDDVYQLGQSHAEADQALFVARARRNTEPPL